MTASDPWNLAYLFPDEVVQARDRLGLILLPLAPIEWHGPHLVMGCDPLLATAFARSLAEKLACPYFPTLFIGTERERGQAMLESLGFPREAYIVGMDFPRNPIGSAYLGEESFALVVRGTVQVLFNRLGFRKVLIVNGHGADNQRAVLDRLCSEMNAETPASRRLMWVYPGFPRSLIAGSIGHATAEETSMLAASYPDCVDLSRLPADGRLKNTDYAVVDGDTFDGSPTPDHTLREQQDPRRHTDPAWGRRLIDEAAREVVEQVHRELLSGP